MDGGETNYVVLETEAGRYGALRMMVANPRITACDVEQMVGAMTRDEVCIAAFSMPALLTWRDEMFLSERIYLPVSAFDSNV